ncbi:MAG: hypothetical protein H6626_13065 [Pseudobdellovibrionaceae bacterium]|nr:hypothetical protein [Bdellovibrionales bacterium]USN47105.1 MAG: hypothetical protein H6626_13065 [Pseudobdellovibrionaceae bacterium]
MGYVEKNLMNNERVMHKTKLNAVHVLALPAFFVVAGIVMVVSEFVFGVFLALAGLFMAVTGFVNLMSSEFAVTNKRIVFKTGLVRRQTVELMLGKIEGMNLG